MSANNIEFRLGSKFEGEGFRQATAALQANRKEVQSSVHGLGELQSAFREISPEASAAVSSVQNFMSAFVKGGIVGGVITLAFQAVSKAVTECNAAIEKIKKAAEEMAKVFNENMLKSLGDAQTRFKSLSDEIARVNSQQADLVKVLNGSVANELSNKIYQLNIEKLQTVTDDMSAGAKAVVEAQYAMKEASLKGAAAVETASNELTAANNAVVQQQRLVEAAEKRVAESDTILADARANAGKDQEYYNKVLQESAAAHKALDDATYALQKSKIAASDASDKLTKAEQDLELTTRTHEAKIRSATKQLDKEMIAKNDLALKEEEAARKWKKYLDGAFDREMNARNELARKEEDASIAFQDYIDKLKESAGLVNEETVDDFLEDLADILEGRAKSSSSSANAEAAENVNIQNPIPMPVQMPQARPAVQGFKEHLANIRQQQRDLRDTFSDLTGKYGRENASYLLALNTAATHRTELQRQQIDYYNNKFIPALVQQFGPEMVNKLFQDANGKVMLKGDWKAFIGTNGKNGALKEMLDEIFAKLGLH